MSAPSLSLAEELLLLGYREEDGKRIAGGTELQAGAAGALVAELALAERIDLDADRITVTDPTPVGDPELDDVLARMRTDAKARKPVWWIGKLNKAALVDRLMRRLGERGVLRVDEHLVLGIFPAHRYPELDPRPEQEIRARMRAAINGEQPDARTAALIALMDACGLNRKVFGDLDRRMLKHRAKEITDSEWAGRATRKVIQNIHAATAGAAAAAAAAGSS